MGGRSFSGQGFERQMATNHLGHVALVGGLWPRLRAGAARVVVVSSTEARDGQLSAQTTREQLLAPSPYDGRQVYRNTKQANLLFGGTASPLRRDRCARHRGRRAPRSERDDLFARQLEQARPRSAARVEQGRLPVRCCNRPPPAHCRSSERSTTARRAGCVGPARFGRLARPPRTARRLRLRQQPGHGRAPVGTHAAGAEPPAATLNASACASCRRRSALEYLHGTRNDEGSPRVDRCASQRLGCCASRRAERARRRQRQRHALENLAAETEPMRAQLAVLTATIDHLARRTRSFAPARRRPDAARPDLLGTGRGTPWRQRRSHRRARSTRRRPARPRRAWPAARRPTARRDAAAGVALLTVSWSTA